MGEGEGGRGVMVSSHHSILLVVGRLEKWKRLGF